MLMLVRNMSYLYILEEKRENNREKRILKLLTKVLIII